MKHLFDFHCFFCDKITEEFATAETEFVQCKCGESAFKVISTPTIRLDGTSGDFPTAHDAWANKREQHARIKERRK